MPKHLLIACLFYIGSLLGLAAIAPFYETGVSRFITPVLSLGFVAIAILFMLRRRGMWQWMKWIAVTGVMINGFFFPAPPFYGDYIVAAKLLVSAEIASCVVILWSLLRIPSTKSWYGQDSV